VHLVVANLLHNRKDEVMLVEPAGAAVLRRPTGEEDIERLLVAEVAQRHRAFIGAQG
jgi:hypothetical protein